MMLTGDTTTKLSLFGTFHNILYHRAVINNDNLSNNLFQDIVFISIQKQEEKIYIMCLDQTNLVK